jgi:hypothetical protein
VRAAKRVGLMAAALVGSFLLALGLFELGVIPPPPVGSLIVEQAAPAPAQAKVERLAARYGCNSEGLAPGVIPAHTIVRHPDGKVRLTSFDEGWGMYTGKISGTLVAVCLR